jgi:hypothetical protein
MSAFDGPPRSLRRQIQDLNKLIEAEQRRFSEAKERYRKELEEISRVRRENPGMRISFVLEEPKEDNTVLQSLERRRDALLREEAQLTQENEKAFNEQRSELRRGLFGLAIMATIAAAVIYFLFLR